MNTFSLSQSKKTPEVIFDVEKALLVFNGISIPEDVYDFYTPLIEWIELNKKEIVSLPYLMVLINLQYFNSSTLKFLTALLKLFIELKSKEAITVTWLVDSDDEDMKETANEISTVVNIPFTIELKKNVI